MLTKSVAGAFAFLSLCCLSAKGYVKLGKNTLQSNGSPGDTQAAITATRPGSTVEIPNGTYSWNSGVTVEGKAIRLRGQSVGRVTITNHSTLESMASVSEVEGDIRPIRFISGEIAALRQTVRPLSG